MKTYSIAKVVALSTLLIGALIILVSVAMINHTSQRIEAAQQTQMGSITRQPITFVENQGQWDPQVAYMARKQGMTAWLLKEGITFQFEKRTSPDHTQGVILQMTFENASDWVSLAGEQEQISKHNFFIGKDRAQWRSGVPSYAQVIYRELYDDVDLRVREAAGWLEYDLLLSQGADLSDVVICCEGLRDLRIDDNGILVIETEYGPITQEPPKAWYALSSGEKIPVDCAFRRIDTCRYGFDVPQCDLGLALVIDPGLEWSTFLGGNDMDDCLSLGLTAAGHIIIVGATESVNFPATAGAYDTTFNGEICDAFVSCLSADGSQLLWSTALGGSSIDVLFEVALDGLGRVIAAGLTQSSDFPATPGAYDTTHNGTDDGIVSCLSSDGSQLLYSTYLGTPSSDMIVALDATDSGDAIVSGYTSSGQFPTTAGAYDTTYNGGVRDAFVTRIATDGTALVWSTYLGGSNDEGYSFQYPLIENTDLMSVSFDDVENVIISGMTTSANFPVTSGAYDITYNGSWDIFVSKLNSTGSDLIFSTYLGGSSWERGFGSAMCLGDGGVIGIGGCTASQDFPVTFNAYDTTFNGGPGDWDAIIALLDSTGSQLLYSTFIGGTGTSTADVIGSMTFDADGELLFAGQAEYGFPVTPGAYDTILNGSVDAFVARLSPDGNGQADLLYSSYVGGNSFDAAMDLAIVDDLTAVLTGFTVSSDFPTIPGAYDTSFNGGVTDGFVLRFGAYVGIKEQTITQPHSSITHSPVFPNPSSNAFNYEINLIEAGQVHLCVVDVTGRLVESLINRQLPAGVHEFAWHPSKELANGIYFLKLEAGDYSATEKLLLIK